ncbi:MAG: hypothetical protein EU532_01225 [Promethearchaeota archaeon]|nr:MAG: hypothetical protein EU532_01225 [Candidatus Lokiarchaeota archaeon]
MEREANLIDKLLDLISGGVFGLISVIVILVGDIIAFSYFPGYSIFNNMVSELGVGPGGIFFNIGLIISGIIIIPYYIDLGKSFIGKEIKENLRKFAISSAIISCITYTLLGFFPSVETNPIIYITHGTLATISIASGFGYLTSYSILMLKADNFNKIQACHGFIVAGVYAIFLFIWIPIIEWIMTFCIISWITSNSISLLYKRH